MVEKLEALEAKQAAQIAQHKSTTHLKTSEPPTLTRGDVEALVRSLPFFPPPPLPPSHPLL